MSSLDQDFFDLTEAFRAILRQDHVDTGIKKELIASPLVTIKNALDAGSLLEHQVLSTEDAKSMQLSHAAASTRYSHLQEAGKSLYPKPYLRAHGEQSALYRAVTMEVRKFKAQNMRPRDMANRLINLIHEVWQVVLEGSVEIQDKGPLDTLSEQDAIVVVGRAQKTMWSLLTERTNEPSAENWKERTKNSHEKESVMDCVYAIDTSSCVGKAIQPYLGEDKHTANFFQQLPDKARDARIAGLE